MSLQIGDLMIQSYGNPKGENEMGRNYSKNNRNPKRVEETTVEQTPAEEVAPAVEPEETVEETKASTVTKAVVDNCKKVRARKNPTIDEDNVVSELAKGTEVVVVDSSNPDWTRVDLGGRKLAWIMSDYLTLI